MNGFNIILKKHILQYKMYFVSHCEFPSEKTNVILSDPIKPQFINTVRAWKNVVAEVRPNIKSPLNHISQQNSAD